MQESCLADGSDHFLGGVGQIVCGDDREAAFFEHLFPLFNFGPFQSNHQWDFEANLFRSFDQGRGDRRQFQAAAHGRLRCNGDTADRPRRTARTGTGGGQGVGP